MPMAKLPTSSSTLRPKSASCSICPQEAADSVSMRAPETESAASWGQMLHEALFGRSVLLLVGSLAIGMLSGRAGMEKMEGFFVTPFQGVLALFLLEMGIVA